MRPDYIFNYENTLHENLKSKIKVSVFVRVNPINDTLIVRIKRESDHVEFERIFDNAHNMILQGLSTDILVDEIIKDLKQYLYKQISYRYFY